MDKTLALNEFAEKFRIEDLLITHCGGWNLSVRPDQLTLGAMVLSIRSGAFNLADLTAQDSVDMGEGFGLAERLARARYGAVRVNILCLMMQDPIVHFHIFPRYDSNQTHHSTLWQDTHWPGAPVIGPAPTAEPVLQGVLADLREALMGSVPAECRMTP